MLEFLFLGCLFDIFINGFFFLEDYNIGNFIIVIIFYLILKSLNKGIKRIYNEKIKFNIR